MKSKVVRSPIATWWKIHSYNPIIEPVEVVAFTSSFVTYVEDRWGLAKNTKAERRERRDDIFPTFEKAKATAVTRAERRIEAAKNALQQHRSFLGNLESLKEPETEAVNASAH